MIGSEKNQYEILPYESRTLIATSTLTIIPILYAFNNGLIFYAITSTGTCIFSILYWSNPVHGWRRNLDLLYAKYSFLVYFGSGVYYISDTYAIITFYLCTYAIAHAYIMTYIFHKKWLIFHTIFHLLSIYTKMFVLFQIKNSLEIT